MFGFGFSVDVLSMPSSRLQAAPPPPLAYLPALSTPGARYRTVVSVERLIADHAGPLAAILGPASTTTDLGDLGDARSGVASADLPPEGAALLRWYDQSGEGRDLAAATVAERPRLRAGIGIGAHPGILFVGRAGDQTRRSTLTATGAGSSGGRTDIMVVHPGSSRQAALLTEQFAAGGAVIDNSGVAGDAGHGALYVAGAAMPGSIHAGPQVLLIVRDGTGVTVWRDGVKGPVGASPLPDVAVASVLIGADRDGQGYNANMRLAALALVDRPLNDADAVAISTALMTRFGIGGVHALNLVHLGDSLVEGVQATDTLGLGQQMVPLIGTRTRYWNLGIAGKTMAAMYADRADQLPGLFEPGTRNVALLDAGINDLNAGASATGDALYTGTATPLAAYLKQLGFSVGITTILPGHTGRSYDDDAVEAQRRRYNVAVRANVAGADLVIDRAAEPRMGAYPAGCDDRALYADGLHPTSAGYALLAPLYAAALRGFIAGG